MPRGASCHRCSSADCARSVRSTTASPAADPPVAQIVWYVDGRAWKLVDRPYTARWPLTPGEHLIEARLPDVEGRSGTVRVFVE
jgi:hypothetical protein